MKYLRISVLATLPLLFACGDKNPTVVDAGLSGTLSFTYTGGGGGSYSATGALAPSASDATASTTTWAVGWKSDTSSAFLANVSRPGGISDVAVLDVKRQTAGSAAIDPSCVTTDPDISQCNSVAFVIGLNSSGSFAFICTVVTGTITIASISGTSATGSFSGTGSCFDATFVSTAFTVTNGSFVVPMLASPPGGL